MKKLWIALLLVALLAFPCHAANLWQKGTGEDVILGSELINDIDKISFENIVDPLDRLLSNYRRTSVVYASASTLTVPAGEVTCENNAATIKRMRRNTSNTTVAWSDIDTGAEAASTTYYVYALCDANAVTFTVKMSASSTAPTGGTYYKKIGTFYNNSSSNIDEAKMYTEPYGFINADSSGVNLGKFIEVRDYSTSKTSSTIRQPSTLYVAYGAAAMSGGVMTITNLPYSSSSSYSVVCTLTTAGVQTQNMQVTAKAAASFSCSDALGGTNTVNWFTMGQ